MRRIIPSIRRDGTLRLLDMQQLSRTSNHTTRVTKYLGEGGADQVNRIFRQNPTFSDPQLVEGRSPRDVEAAEHTNPGNAEAQSRLLAQRAPQVEVQPQ